MRIRDGVGLLRNRPGISVLVIFLVVALISGGLWLALHQPDEPDQSFQGRVESIPGVQAVTPGSGSDPVPTVRLEQHLEPDNVAQVISNLREIPDYPALELEIDGVTVSGYRNMTRLVDETPGLSGALVAAARHPEVESIYFSDATMDVSVQDADFLEVADDLLAGMADSSNDRTVTSGFSLGVIPAGAAERTLKVDTEDLELATQFVHQLQRALQEDGRSFVEAELRGQRGATVTLQAAERDQAAALSEDASAALPVHSSVKLIVDGIEISGDRPDAALAFVEQMEDAGATVSRIGLSTDDKNPGHVAAEVDSGTADESRIQDVLSLLGQSDGLPADASVELTSSRSGEQADALDLQGEAGQLSSHTQLFLALDAAGYDVTFRDAAPGTTGSWDEATGGLAVRPRDTSLIDQAEYQDLVQVFRENPWQGSMVLQIFGLADTTGSSTKDDYGLRFAAESDGEARDVFLPGQMSESDSELPGNSASQFVREWDATAG